MKKMICYLLCLSLLCAAVPMKASAADGWGHFDGDSDVDLDDYFDDSTDSRLQRIENTLFGMVKDSTLKQQLANQMLVYNTLMGGIKTISSVIGLANGVINLLKLSGIIETPEQQQTELLSSIYDTVISIQTTVNRINVKTDKIQSTLNSEFSKMDYNFNLNRYDSYQAAWSSFFAQGGPVAKLQELYNDYQSQINNSLIDYAQSWQENSNGGLRALYTDEFTTQTASGKNMTGAYKDLPSTPKGSDDGKNIAASITLPGSYIHVDNNVITADNVMDSLFEAIADAVHSALQDGKLETSDPDFNESFTSKSDDEKSAFEEKITNDLFDSLLYEVSYEAANTKVGVGTFASKVQSAFDNYYNTLFGKNDVTSPLVAAYQRLSLTHGFEGEIKDDASNISVYLTQLSMMYGSFATFVTAMDSSMKVNTKEKVSEEGNDCALIPLEYYNAFITGNDNYCYPLGMAIEYHEVQAKSVYDITNQTYTVSDLNYQVKHKAYDWTLLDLTKEYDEFGTDQYNQQVKENAAVLGATSLSSRDISLLYCYFIQNGGESFMEYLQENNVIIPNADEIVIVGSNDPNINAHSAEFIAGMPIIQSVDKKIGETLTFQDLVYITADKEKKVLAQLKKDQDFASIWTTGTVIPSSYKKLLDGSCKLYDAFVADYFDASGTIGGKSMSSNISSRTQANACIASRMIYACGFGVYDIRAGSFVFSNCDLLQHDHTSLPNDFVLHRLTFSKNYGMLVQSTSANKDNNSTASVLGQGNTIIIVATAVVVIASVTGICIVNGKKKKKQGNAQ